MKINNKDVLQSYILTTAKYDYSTYEKRIMYRIIELLQEYTKGKKMNEKHQVSENIFGRLKIKMPISSFLKNEKDTNHTRVKSALKSLKMKVIEYEDNEVYEAISLINYPKLNKKYEDIEFELHPLIVGAFLDFSKGYSKYELVTAMQFDSVYAMRFYELLSGQKRPLSYNIDKLKEMFKIENKYTLNSNFINRVVLIAQKELDEKAPYSFDFKPIKTGRKITGLTFFPRYLPKNRDMRIEEKRLRKQTSLKWELSDSLIKYLKLNYGFSDKEIKNNLDLLVTAENSESFDILYFISEQKSNAEGKSNPKGWILGAIKKQLANG